MGVDGDESVVILNVSLVEFVGYDVSLELVSSLTCGVGIVDDIQCM